MWAHILCVAVNEALCVLWLHFMLLLFKIQATCSCAFLRIVIGWCRKMCIIEVGGATALATIDTMQKPKPIHRWSVCTSKRQEIVQDVYFIDFTGCTLHCTTPEDAKETGESKHRHLNSTYQLYRQNVMRIIASDKEEHENILKSHFNYICISDWTVSRWWNSQYTHTHTHAVCWYVLALTRLFLI